MDSKSLYKQKQEKIRRTFLSHMRNFNNFENITNEDIIKADEYAKQIKDHFGNTYLGHVLNKYMQYVNINLHNHKNKDFLVLILIRTLDPDLKLYKIYQLECTEKRIKMKSLATLGFYEPELIKYEKAYIKKFCDMDEFDFTKKLEP